MAYKDAAGWTWKDGRVIGRETPSGFVSGSYKEVIAKGGGGTYKKPEPTPSQKSEATISRAELEKLTGKHYRGLREQVPAWQAKQILRQEGFQVREEGGKLIAEKTVEKPATLPAGYGVMTKEALTRKLRAPNYDLAGGFGAGDEKYLTPAQVKPSLRPYGARPTTPTISPEWEAYRRERAEIMGKAERQTMRGAAEVGGALLIGGATGAGLRMLSGISTKAATAAGVGIAGYSVYDYGKRTLRNLREGRVGSALYESSLFAIAGAGVAKGYGVAGGYVGRVKDYAAAKAELKKYSISYREYPNPLLEKQARIEHVLESFMPRGEAQRLGTFLREERGELLLKLEKKPLKSRTDVVDLTNIRYDREYDFLYDVSHGVGKAGKIHSYPETRIGRTGWERMRRPRRYVERAPERLAEPKVGIAPEIPIEQGLNMQATRQALFQRARRGQGQEQLSMQLDLLTPGQLSSQLQEPLSLQEEVPALQQPRRPRRRKVRTEVPLDVVLPGFEEPPAPRPIPPRISLDFDLVDFDERRGGKGYKPWTFRNPWAEPEDMLGILFGAGSPSRSRKRRGRKKKRGRR